MRAESFWADDATPPPSSSNLQQFPQGQGKPARRRSLGNVLRLLAQREIAPRTRHLSKRLWGDTSKFHLISLGRRDDAARDVRRNLLSWVEAESLRNLSAKYCPLLPPPRSTIAAAFSPDGKTLASTHGDHTVKTIDYQTGSCLKVLSGHRRTPWVVRFHPLYPEILASGSLDHEVRLWDANTAECIGSRDFYRPIASIAFHAQGDVLAVASGHKLYIWHYNRRGEASSPTVVLKTRRSLRAVHFHPHAAPFLLTAEVNDLDSSESSMTLATASNYLRYPPPTVYLSNAHSSVADELPLMSLPFLLWPSLPRDSGRVSLQHTDGDLSSSGVTSTRQRVENSASLRLLTYSTPTGQYELLLSPIESNGSPTQAAGTSSYISALENEASQSGTDTIEAMEVQPEDRTNQFFHVSDPAGWELPFLQGWLIGQTQAGQRTMRPYNGAVPESSAALSEIGGVSPLVSSVASSSIGQSRTGGRSGLRHRSSRSRMTSAVGSGDGASHFYTIHEESDPQPVASRLQSELASSLAAAAAAELPCTVKLRIWSHNIKDPCAPLDTEKCRLTIPHAVLCSEMGAHFSPCGRFLAACVACMLPRLEAEPGLQGQFNQDVIGASSSPTRHPISAHQVMYELRIYSLEEATFGLVLASRAIRAAHCLTSIQFSPTSEHLLLAYGRRHSSLLKSIVIDGEMTVPIYTILEVYSVSDMELVRILPSADDEVNVACFHPSAGGGLVYGTKEGKLRILQYDGSLNVASGLSDENMIEVPTYALEC